MLVMIYTANSLLRAQCPQLISFLFTIGEAQSGLYAGILCSDRAFVSQTSGSQDFQSSS